MNNCSVAIVVPFYKTRLNELEMIAFNQLCYVLGDYPIYCVVPDSLDDLDCEHYGMVSVVKFSASFFSCVEAYSELCMSAEFYEAFLEYEYILIYQLDAFVFSNRLKEFCDKGFDYIGAPVPGWCWNNLGYHVGNGGFSLRNVSRCLEVTHNKPLIFNRFKEEYGDELAERFLIVEDCFFSYCGYKDDIDFRVPDLIDAFSFSIEFNINGIYEKIEDHLPFGCHRWHDNRFNVWWPIISRYGHRLCEDEINRRIIMSDKYDYMFLAYLVKKGKLTHDQLNRIRQAVGCSVRIWGYGRDGMEFRQIIEKVGLSVSNIYDKYRYNGIDVLYPASETLKKSCDPIIITSTKYEKEILDDIISEGFVEGISCYLWSSFAKRIIKSLELDKIGEIILG